jgi:hypothetical protein
LGAYSRHNFVSVTRQPATELLTPDAYRANKSFAPTPPAMISPVRDEFQTTESQHFVFAEKTARET